MVGRTFHGASLCALVVWMGCGKFESSPYATTHPDLPHDVNAMNLARLAAREPFDDDTIKILFTGDSQRFYEEQEAIVQKANSLAGVDIFILAGDIVDFGLGQEYLWVYERLSELQMPWLAVVGNHDLLANGSILYQTMFGPLDFAFNYKGYRFIFHDTNGREYGNTGAAPRLPWMHGQMQDASAEHIIAVSHVPPQSVDFDPALVQPYMDLLGSDPRTILSLHGHNGSYNDANLNEDHVRYIVCNAMVNPEFLLLKIHHGVVEAQVMNYLQ